LGAAVERISEGEMLSTGRRVRFEIPSGHLIELYAEKEAVPYPGQLRNPRPWTEAAEHGIAPIRMDHALLYGPRVNDNLELPSGLDYPQRKLHEAFLTVVT
jgi:catechol 2,3-dioxygenase